MSIHAKLLRAYLILHGRFHGQIVARLQQPLDGGLHYTNKFNRRHEFFGERVVPTDIALDIACGTGTILKKIAHRIGRGYGIERDPGNLALSRADAPINIEFIAADIFAFDYGAFVSEKGITVAVLSHILEHIEDVPGFLKTIKVPRLLICVPSEEHAFADLVKSLGIPYLTDHTHFREYTREQLRGHLAAAGYEAISMGFNQEGEIICEAHISSTGK